MADEERQYSYRREYQDGGDWQEWRRYVIEALRASEEREREIMKQIQQLQTKLAVLQVKAAGWGAIAGSIGGLIMMIALLIKWMTSK